MIPVKAKPVPASARRFQPQISLPKISKNIPIRNIMPLRIQPTAKLAEHSREFAET